MLYCNGLLIKATFPNTANKSIQFQTQPSMNMDSEYGQFWLLLCVQWYVYNLVVWKWALMWIVCLFWKLLKTVLKFKCLCSKPVQQVCGAWSSVSFCTSKARSNEAARQQLSMHAQLREFLSTPSPAHNTRTDTFFILFSKRVSMWKRIQHKKNSVLLRYSQVTQA